MLAIKCFTIIYIMTYCWKYSYCATNRCTYWYCKFQLC